MKFLHYFIARPLLFLGMILELIAYALMYLVELTERFHDWSVRK